MADSVKTRFGYYHSETDLEENLIWADCIIIVTDHDEFKNNEKLLDALNNHNKVIIDTRNTIKDNDSLDNLNYIKL